MDGASVVSRRTGVAGRPGTRGRNGAFRISLDKACLTPKPVLL
ncbi:hypothetical protein [Mycobacterium sp. E3251]|nr:hypothetical protein [Mycobacterium sp. E3251]